MNKSEFNSLQNAVIELYITLKVRPQEEVSHCFITTID